MKRALLALLTLALPCALLAQTIAVVDMERILQAHPNTPNDQKTLADTLADYSKERDTLEANLDRMAAERDKTVQEAQNPMLAPAKMDELRQKAIQQDRALQEAALRAEAQMAERTRTLQEMERRFVKRTADEIQTHITAEAKKRGIDIVLHKEGVAYVKPELDLTDTIITLCGGTPQKAEEAKPDAPKAEKAEPPAEKAEPPAKKADAPAETQPLTPLRPVAPPRITL